MRSDPEPADRIEAVAAIEDSSPPAYVEDPLPTTVGRAFPPPEGAPRVDGGAFGAWLLERPVLAIETPVRTFDGHESFGHDARVIDLPLVPGDLQQCTDTALRLRAEWQRSIGVSPSFHSERNEELPWSRFEAGEQPYRVDGKLLWKTGSTRKWEDWLSVVFNRINTLKFDTVDADTPRPGDMLQRLGTEGRIGHIVVLMDVAKTEDTTYVLVGEGFMPAQSFHIERGPYNGWFQYKDDELVPSQWLLQGAKLRRWKD